MSMHFSDTTITILVCQFVAKPSLKRTFFLCKNKEKTFLKYSNCFLKSKCQVTILNVRGKQIAWSNDHTVVKCYTVTKENNNGNTWG